MKGQVKYPPTDTFYPKENNTKGSLLKIKGETNPLAQLVRNPSLGETELPSLEHTSNSSIWYKPPFQPPSNATRTEFTGSRLSFLGYKTNCRSINLTIHYSSLSIADGTFAHRRSAVIRDESLEPH